ncbi:hypothetical protein [Streptomyces sp. NPDC057616]|uniref:hypothetical protein n=1 Tax=Streptomyces sp. NPDC057616 TaxID=3346183 RepID=UPI0036B5448F
MRRTIPHTTLAVAALALVLAGCGGQSDSGKGGSSTVSSSPTPTTSPSTSPPGSPSGCAAAATLAAHDSGRTVCLAVGETLRVSLDGTAKRPWKPVAVKGSGLEAANSGIVLQPGDASAAYKAVSAGKTRLQSTRPLCAAQTGRVSCLGIQEWWVTVVVR